MKYNFYFSIISSLFLLVTNISFTPVFMSFEVNDGEVKNVMPIANKIWIETKIEKDSEIFMDITCFDENITIKKEDIRYTKYCKGGNSTEFTQ